MEGETSLQPKNNEGLLSEFSSDNEEWDTDLEDCCERTRPISIPLEQVYLAACTELGIPPVSAFIKQMTSTKVYYSCFIRLSLV